jgi:hypothetical protein
MGSWSLGLIGNQALDSWALGHLVSLAHGHSGYWALGHLGSCALWHSGSWDHGSSPLGHLGSRALGLMVSWAHWQSGSWALGRLVRDLGPFLFPCAPKCLPRLTICGLLINIYLFFSDGRNIACTLASKHASWFKEDTYKNLMEATQRIGGLSMGDILKHPRCSDSVTKTNFGRNAVKSAKNELKELSAEEKDSLSSEALDELRIFDHPLGMWYQCNSDTCFFVEIEWYEATIPTILRRDLC